jgi:hypothetical protein
MLLVMLTVRPTVLPSHLDPTVCYHVWNNSFPQWTHTRFDACCRMPTMSLEFLFLVDMPSAKARRYQTKTAYVNHEATADGRCLTEVHPTILIAVQCADYGDWHFELSGQHVSRYEIDSRIFPRRLLHQFVRLYTTGILLPLLHIL